jgi:hypothetical protein
VLFALTDQPGELKPAETGEGLDGGNTIQAWLFWLMHDTRVFHEFSTTLLPALSALFMWVAYRTSVIMHSGHNSRVAALHRIQEKAISTTTPQQQREALKKDLTAAETAFDQISRTTDHQDAFDNLSEQFARLQEQLVASDVNADNFITLSYEANRILRQVKALREGVDRHQEATRRVEDVSGEIQTLRAAMNENGAITNVGLKTSLEGLCRALTNLKYDLPQAYDDPNFLDRHDAYSIRRDIHSLQKSVERYSAMLQLIAHATADLDQIESITSSSQLQSNQRLAARHSDLRARVNALKESLPNVWEVIDSNFNNTYRHALALNDSVKALLIEIHPSTSRKSRGLNLPSLQRFFCFAFKVKLFQKILSLIRLPSWTERQIEHNKVLASA